MPPLQMAPGALPTKPFSWMAGLLAQTCWSGPAFTTGTGSMSTTRVSLTATQLPLPEVVSASCTVPAASSPSEGM